MVDERGRDKNQICNGGRRVENEMRDNYRFILLVRESHFRSVSYLIFMPRPCTHRMHDPGSIVPHIWQKVFTDNQMSRIKYNYYINSVSKDYDDSQRNGTVEDSITPQE
jgi:hypothetical protein